MADAVPFNYNTFVLTFPAFADLGEQQAALYWGIAEGYWRNDGTSPCTTVTEQARLMNLLTAHIAKMLAPNSAGGQGGDLTGRITNASEGSVSVQTEFASETPPSMAWYVQTQYGAMFWQLTAPYRTMKYRAPPPRYAGNVGFFGRYRR